MAAGFRTRRIKTESSIGDKLKRARTRRRLSVAQAEEETRIRARFILALEGDSWDQIPSEAYGRGYLESYAGYLQLAVEPIMRQYARERELYARKCQDGPVELTPMSHLSLPKFFLTPRFFTIGAAVLVLMIGVGMVGYQIRKFTALPFLEVATPAQAKGQEGSDLVVSTDSINITGRTVMGAAVEVNGRAATVDDGGGFRSTVALQKGSNSILVEATDGSGKKSSQVLNVVAQ
ncbi:MAG: helix-turn-helix domain-containing protein [bacterium]